MGGGLSGLFAAILLARSGFPVTVYERDGDPRAGEVSGRRPSLNLAISERGLAQLARAGLRQALLERAASARGRLVHHGDGRLEFEPYGGGDQALHFVLRRDFADVLLQAAAALPDLRVHFGHRCLAVDPERRTLHLRDGRTGNVHSVPAGPVVGADGVHSVVRRCLWRHDRFDYSQAHLAQGYKEMLLPPTLRQRGIVRQDVLHVWRRDPCLLLGFPNRDGSLALSLHLPFDGDASFAAVDSESALAALFADRFPDVGPLRPDMTRQFLSARPNSMVTLRCRPWSLDGWAVLLGDAAHAMVPHYGQGATMGLEDASALAGCLDAFAPDWGRAFDEYESRRRPDAAAMADLSLAHVGVLGGDPALDDPVLAGLAEGALSSLLGADPPPLYTLVAFTEIPLRDVATFHRWWRSTVRGVITVAGRRRGQREMRAAAQHVLDLAGGPVGVDAWLRRQFPFWRGSGAA